MNFLSLLSFAASIAAAGLALVGLLRGRRTISDWAFVAGMSIIAVRRLLNGLSLAAGSVDEVIAWQQWTLLGFSLLPGAWLLFGVTYARGNAAVFLTKWRAALVAASVLPPVLALVFRETLFTVARAPGTEPWVLGLSWPAILIYIIALTSFVFVLMNLERTFRASVGTMRWRIKFMLLGVGVILVVHIYTASQALLFRAIEPAIESVNSVGMLVATPVLLWALFRSGSFEADVYPSQSILQGSLTVLLAGVYLLVVGLFANVATYLGGDASFAIKALLVLLSLVLLAVLLQSDRLRLHLRRFVSRHFQRPLYDYRTEWRKFTDATASCVEQTDLCRAIVKLTAEIFQALSVSIWLVNEKQDGFVLASSTSISGAKCRECEPRPGESDGVRRYFERHPAPVDFEEKSDEWAVALRHWHPTEFANGGDRVCVPLLRQTDLIGLIIVGDRVAGAPFLTEDFEMLQCIANQATASLLNIQLAQRLMQAKELEAFQTMAAFFVHDLKNAASTLNLMLQNLPVHFHDPAFREDALRGISKTVTHINGLIGRLGLLRHELKIRRSDADLNEIVSATLSGLAPAGGARLVKEAGSLPKVSVDREQIQKVVINLVLNAAEASANGDVRIATAQNNGWAVLTVADNGCGMSPEFLQQSLFRPFQTTKKNGLGIGMFQSRMIVEAHGGRVEVESELGKGTTFRVFLPLAGN